MGMQSLPQINTVNKLALQLRREGKREADARHLLADPRKAGEVRRLLLASDMELSKAA